MQDVRLLDIEALPPGQITRCRVQLTTDALGSPISVPLLVARGAQPGPVLGLNAALHGNELNGIEVIRRFINNLDPATLRGTVVGVLVANLPGYTARQRRFTDGVDLNTVMPGKPAGSDSNIYGHALFERVITCFTTLIDLHTASTGRINSYYIRADMDDPATAELAHLQNAQIILHNKGGEHTLRRAAAGRGITAITPELCDPSIWQPHVIEQSVVGVRNVAVHLGLIDGEITPAQPAVECIRSFWMYTQEGGLLEVLPKVAQHVTQGEVIARISNIYGDVLREYTAPESGIVIGKSTQPVNQSGGRILHLGILK